jgi:hypothetical protein
LEVLLNSMGVGNKKKKEEKRSLSEILLKEF